MGPFEGTTAGTWGPEGVSTKLKRIAELARTRPGVPLTTLAHHIDIGWLEMAYALTRKDGAVGVDRKTAASYEENLEANLQSLLERFKSGRYKAPPVRRVHIPKGSGKQTRPIGIPTFEDKVLQRAVAMILEAVYEQEFSSSSYGFRPGRSAHDALEALRVGLMNMQGAAVLELDIQKFFDTLDHGHLRTLLDQRVRDGVLRRTIDKWLAAGVLENGSIHYPAAGSPQGGVISPILANIYLHYVLDVWLKSTVFPRLKAPAFFVRYADDAVMAFRREDDAERVMEVLPKRFGKYGLSLHPEKTRLVPFWRPEDSRRLRPPRQGGAPRTFDFLGFTHYWGKTRKGGRAVKKQTARSRLVRSLRTVGIWLAMHRHLPMEKQWTKLSEKIRGHYAYFGLTGNGRALQNFFFQVTRLWYKWLNRRSERRHLDWPKFRRLLARYPLPPVRIVHSAVPRAANA